MFQSLFLDNKKEENIPMYRDVLCQNGVPVVRDGRFLLCDGAAALKSFSERVLITNRYRHEIFSFNHGAEFEGLIGKAYNKNLVLSEVERYVKECLLVNKYIKNVSDISCDFKLGNLTISFKINTIYGDEGVMINV